MNVKAQGLLNAAKWVEEEYGRDALGAVVRACSPAVRERYTSAIAINWHPMSELVEFLREADRQLGRGNGKLAEEIGAAGARANVKGMVLRLVFYMAKPEFLIMRVAGLWRQFNDEGQMQLLTIDKHSMSIEVKGVTSPHALFCGSITGWCREVVRASGAESPVSKHVACVTRGDASCIWEVRYSGVEADDTPPSSAPRTPPRATDGGGSHGALQSRPPLSAGRVALPASQPPSSRGPNSSRGSD